MLKIEVLASGSKGNCTWIQTSSDENILCDVGICYKKISAAMNYQPIDYAIVTHEHTDHANVPAIKTLLENGTDVYMTAGTRDALKLKNRHNLHTFTAGLHMTPLRIGSCTFKALCAMHDAAEPIVFQIADFEDRVLYSTDTFRPPIWNDGTDFFTKIIVETNFSEKVLAESEIDDWQKKRIFNSHTSIERVLLHFENWKRYQGTAFDALKSLKELHLIHISKRHGDGSDFKSMLEKVVDIPIFTH